MVSQTIWWTQDVLSTCTDQQVVQYIASTPQADLREIFSARVSQDSGQTLFHYCLDENRFPLASHAILDLSPPMYYDSYGNTPMHLCAAYNHEIYAALQTRSKDYQMLENEEHVTPQELFSLCQNDVGFQRIGFAYLVDKVEHEWHQQRLLKILQWKEEGSDFHQLFAQESERQRQLNRLACQALLKKCYGIAQACFAWGQQFGSRVTIEASVLNQNPDAIVYLDTKSVSLRNSANQLSYLLARLSTQPKNQPHCLVLQKFGVQLPQTAQRKTKNFRWSSLSSWIK